MAHIITMPAVVADATEAELHSWLVEVGDQVTSGQPIAEVETEKATVEMESDAEGTVARLLVSPGTSVAVGDPVAVLTGPGEDDSAVDEEITRAADETTSATEHPVPHDTEAPATDPDENEQSGQTAPAQSPEPAHSPRVFSSPLARKMAKDLGVEIGDIRGSGPDGRVLRRDVEAAAAEHRHSTADQSAAGRDHANQRGESTSSQDADFVDIPLSGMRKAIARRLTESKTTVPHFYLSADVEMDTLLTLRRDINSAAASTDLKVTVNDLLLKALGAALQEVPEANATWEGDRLRQYSTVDISVAIATEGGLLTPVVRDIGRLSVSSLAQTMTDFKHRAGTGKIRQHELEGGSFSLTNLGMYGTKEFSAILNPPQAGILAVGAAEKRPVVREDTLGIATVMSCTLSADHRVIDGAVAAQLMAAFKRLVEQPITILI